MARSTFFVACGIVSVVASGIVLVVLGVMREEGVDLGDLEARLERIEHRLSTAADQAMVPVPVSEPAAVGTVESSADETEADGIDTQDDELSAIEIRERFDNLQERVRGLEEDPLQRGYAFIDSASAELRRKGIRSLASVAKHDPEARAMIRNLIRDEDARVRQTAIDVISDLEDQEATPLLLESLGDPDAAVRREAIDALADVGSTESGMEIAELLDDPDRRVRAEAADVLGRLKSAETAEYLLQALNDRQEEVRGEAIASLGEVGAREAAPLLRNLYDEDPGRHRWRLVFALGRLGDEVPYQAEVQRLSQKALEAEAPRARRDAVRGLNRMVNYAAQLRLDSGGDATDVFRQALDDPSSEVRNAAERALRRRR